jgi:NAD(P)-dependent dehydrogenase (short-subunit alcohol dehydrogenase family)
MKVCLVTGGTRGIGLGVARALRWDGWELALSGLRPEADVKGRARGAAGRVLPGRSLEERGRGRD